MVVEDRWLLPDGIDELLPDRAAALERLRRECLDLLHSWGYEFVVPPLIEYLDSLLSGMGEDLDLQTFKLIDQLNGRMLGVRADITPQAARIEAHRLRRTTPTRLCYIGTVLHTLPENFAGSRNPVQLGAELFGHAGLEADAEILRVMQQVLARAAIDELWIDLGHIGIFRALASAAGLTTVHEARLFEALQRKDASEIDAITRDQSVDAAVAAGLAALVELNGDVGVVDEAASALRNCPAPVGAAIEELRTLIGMIDGGAPAVRLHVDLAELRSYRYHTGIIFAAYTPQQGNAIAWGGRYDNVGSIFGHPRPATGFSTDLKRLVMLVDPTVDEAASAILAPSHGDDTLDTAITELRAQGQRVVRALPGADNDPVALGCDRELVLVGGRWQARPLNEDG